MSDRHGPSQRVLVTGAFGLVGSEVVQTLADAGHAVIATDLDIPAHRSREHAIAERPGVRVRWADVTNAADVDQLVTDAAPTAIVHLAAIIPPFCYSRREVARAVNVEGTAHLVRAAKSLPAPPRFVLASSVAVYGSRNPYRTPGPLSPTMSRQPSDLYGSHKVMAEDIVTTSGLPWVVLRLGGVLTAEPRWGIDRDLVFFEAVLPADGRIHTVDVRDVATAFAAATETPRIAEVFLIGGDRSHRITQSAISADSASAMGLRGGIPAGRPGDPTDDQGWFATDWMDTAGAQDALAFQRHSLPAIHAELRHRVGRKRLFMPLIAPFLRFYLRKRSPYRQFPGRFAAPWTVIERLWGDPSPEEVRL